MGGGGGGVICHRKQESENANTRSKGSYRKISFLCSQFAWVWLVLLKDWVNKYLESALGSGKTSIKNLSCDSNKKKTGKVQSKLSLSPQKNKVALSWGCSNTVLYCTVNILWVHDGEMMALTTALKRFLNHSLRVASVEGTVFTSFGKMLSSSMDICD